MSKRELLSDIETCMPVCYYSRAVKLEIMLPVYEIFSSGGLHISSEWRSLH